MAGETAAMRCFAFALMTAAVTPLCAHAQTSGAPPLTAADINAVVFASHPPAPGLKAWSLQSGVMTAPAPITVRAGGLGFSITPHASRTEAPNGQSTSEFGASVQISSAGQVLQDRLRAMGVKNGADQYGDQGRLYLFAAVRGQAVGLNMQQTEGSLRRAGWSTDQSSALIGDGQIGVGWRKGGMETTLGYVHRGIHVKNAPYGVTDSMGEDMAALAFTFHPF